MVTLVQAARSEMVADKDASPAKNALQMWESGFV